jgi:hypothetical protein
MTTTNYINSGYITKMGDSLTHDGTAGRPVDDIDYPHSGLIKALNIMASTGHTVLNGSIGSGSKNFNMDMDDTTSSTYTTITVRAGTIIREGVLVSIAQATLTEIASGTPSVIQFIEQGSSGENFYHVIVVNSSNVINIRNPSAKDKVADLTNGDIPIAILRVENGETPTARHLQYLTTDVQSNSVSIAYDNSDVYTEAGALTGDVNGITMTGLYKLDALPVATAATTDKILAQETSTNIIKTLTAQEIANFAPIDTVANGADNRIATFTSASGLNGETGLTYDGEDLVSTSAASTIQVVDTTNNYAITVKGGGGPRIQFGDLDSAVDSFMDIGAYSGMNNIDTQSRNFRVWGNTNTHIYIDENNTRIGLGGLTTPLALLSTKGNVDKGISGTVTTTDASTTITGSGTSFLSELRVGQTIKIGAEIRVLLTIVSDTVATTTAAFTSGGSGVVSGGAAYIDDVLLLMEDGNGTDVLGVRNNSIIALESGIINNVRLINGPPDGIASTLYATDRHIIVDLAGVPMPVQDYDFTLYGDNAIDDGRIFTIQCVAIGGGGPMGGTGVDIVLAGSDILYDVDNANIANSSTRLQLVAGNSYTILQQARNIFRVVHKTV